MLRLTFLILFLAGTARADELPPVPDGGLVHLKNEPCVEPVFNLEGTCYYSRDVKGNEYVAFFTKQELGMVIWQIINGERVEIWRRGADV